MNVYDMLHILTRRHECRKVQGQLRAGQKQNRHSNAPLVYSATRLQWHDIQPDICVFFSSRVFVAHFLSHSNQDFEIVSVEFLVVHIQAIRIAAISLQRCAKFGAYSV